MIGLISDLEGQPGVLIPRESPSDDDLHTWARDAAVDLLSAAGDTGPMTPDDVSQALVRMRRLPQAPDAVATIAIIDPARTVVGALRIALSPSSMSDDDQRSALSAVDAVFVNRRPYRSHNLGEGIFCTVITEPELGQQVGSARWLFSRPAGSVLAVLGPGPPRVIAALAPSVQSVLDMVAVKGLDAGGVAFADQESLLVALTLAGDSVWET